MGHLTESMTRLCEEIRNLRNARMEITNNRREAVIDMRSLFRANHAEMAKRLENDRCSFIFALKRTVKGLRQEVKSDIIGARIAWFKEQKQRFKNYSTQSTKR